MSSVKQETISGLKWSAIEKFGLQAIQFGLGLIMARLLTPSDYGVVGVLAIFFSISSTFIDSGFGGALMRKLDRTENDFSTVFYFNVGVSLFCYLVLFFAAPFIGEFFKMPILVSVLRIQAINMVLNAFVIIQTTKLTIDVNFKALAQRSLISSIISGICGVIMAYIGWGVWALVFQGLIFSVIDIVLLNLYCPWRPLLIFSKQSFTELGSYGSKMLGAGLLNTIYENLTPLAIGRYYTPQDLGQYNRGISLADFPKSFINSLLVKVSFPVLVKLQEDDERLISVYRKYICISSLGIVFLCMLLAAIARPLVLLLLTEKWESCVIFLQIYCFAAMFGHISSINLNLLQVKGRSDLFLRLEIIKKTISTAILLASIPFGVIAICFSKVLYTQIANFINTYYTGKLFNLGYIDQLKDYSAYFFASLIACIPAYLLTWIDMPYICSIVIGSLISLSIYYALLRKDSAMMEIMDLIKSYFPNNKR